MDVWDPSTQRKRRKVLFTEDGSDGSDYDDESQSDQEDSESVDKENPSFQMAQADSSQPLDSTACVGLPEEKPSLEMEEETPAFADSEDELEMSGNEAEGWELCSDEDGEDGLEENDGEMAVENEKDDVNTILEEESAIYMETEVGNYAPFRLH